MESVLVTGGAGYIGSHTAKLLARSGFRPVVLDNLTRGHAESVQWGPLVKGDIADASLVKRVVREYGIQAALHFAALAYVDESVRNPRNYFQNNVTGSLNLLDALVDSGVRHVVFSSTCATYGIPESVPISESNAQRPVNPYGESKLFVERVLEWYGKAYGLNWTALRYFNAAGADEDGEIGEDHDPETHIIPRAILAALGSVPELQVFGTDYPTADGTAVRDYIHVTDLAEAHVLALKHLLNGGKSQAINLGTGTGHSVLEVIRAVEGISGLRVPRRIADRRPGDPPMLVASNARASEVLGWSPKHSDLETMVRTAWAWEKSREMRYRVQQLSSQNFVLVEQKSS
jgi:UDP-arabinose 4-epimerase